MEHLIHLKKDKKLAVALHKPEVLNPSIKKNLHLSLCSSIMSQQLSTKVAAVIYSRFLTLFKKKIPSVKDILTVDIETMRCIGLSYNKAQYILNVCAFFEEKKLTDRKLQNLRDDELLVLLTQIKGVGRWTVEMLLMFSMGREDIFAVDDLGIQQGMAGIYDLDLHDKKKLRTDMQKISENWRPYRSYACRYIWRWKDGG